MPYLRANCKKIHYVDWAPANGAQPRETFLLVHGLGSSQNYYAAVAPYLTAAGYRVVALDTTGQGRSPYTGIEQSISSLASDMIDALDALSIPKAVVVGHSMGGLTVPQAAALFPDRVSAIVLLGPVYPDPATIPMFEGRIAAVAKEGMQPMADTIPAGALGSAAAPVHRAFVRELLMGSQPDGYISLCRVIISAVQDKPLYARVKCPVLVVAGDEDKAAPVAMAERILSEMGAPKGETRLEVQKGIGHWMAVEAAEDVARRIVDFFKAVQ